MAELSCAESICLVLYWNSDKEFLVSNPTDFPDVSDSTSRVKEIQEPIVKATIIVPEGMGAALSFLTYSLKSTRILRWNAGSLLCKTRRRFESQIPRLWARILFSYHAYMHSSFEWNRFRLLWPLEKSKFGICKFWVSCKSFRPLLIYTLSAMRMRATEKVTSLRWSSFWTENQ